MKTYTIGQIAERAGLSTDTLRYYDKQGLLPFVARAENGYRIFTEEDFAWLDTIACLKGTGMELKDIRTFIRWCMQGESTMQNRLDLILARKREVESQIEELRGYLTKLEEKIAHYREVLDAAKSE
ncbi:MAG: MerR family transcriptional regulator [Candidatus Spyradocola sp.]|jgi:DNA-binding transcriptional MerR regulator